MRQGRQVSGISQAAEGERIEVTDDDVEAEVERLTASVPTGPQAQQLKEMFTSEDGRATIRRNLKTSRTLARLVEIATQDGEAPKTMKEPAPRKGAAKRKKADSAADTPPAQDAAPDEGADAASEASE